MEYSENCCRVCLTDEEHQLTEIFQEGRDELYRKCTYLDVSFLQVNGI